MLRQLTDPRGYFFWLIVVSALCFGLERAFPWRRHQKPFRQQFGQDVFWLVFNGHFAALLIAGAAGLLFNWATPGVSRLSALNLVANRPLWLQVVVFFVFKDLMEWGVHNLLHRTPWLWTFHKVHHSIRELDWIGNFRFHWMEIVVYRSLTYLPLVLLGVDGRVILWVAVLTTLIGHLSHSNLNATWGPLRYVFNSPRMHVWHHMWDLPTSHPKGLNFGISLSLWDWVFGTAWWPEVRESPSQQPERLGFPGLNGFPATLPARLIHPIPLPKAVSKDRRAAGRSDA